MLARGWWLSFPGSAYRTELYIKSPRRTGGAKAAIFSESWCVYVQWRVGLGWIGAAGLQDSKGAVQARAKQFRGLAQELASSGRRRGREVGFDLENVWVGGLIFGLKGRQH